jgi:hypothetical protein
MYLGIFVLIASSFAFLVKFSPEVQALEDKAYKEAQSDKTALLES